MEFKFKQFKIRGNLVFLNDCFNIFTNSESSPAFYCQFNSFGVHKHGHEGLWKLLHSLLKDLDITPSRLLTPRLSRADIQVDAHDGELNYTPHNVVTKSRTCEMKYENHIEQNALTVGKRGSDTAYLRIYNKRLEMEKFKRFWMLEIYGSNPLYIPDAPITRFEFELGKNWLRRKQIITWEDLKNNMGNLMRYLFYKQVRLVDANYTQNLKNRSRAPVLPVWEEIQYWVNRYYDGHQVFMEGLTKRIDIHEAKKYAEKNLISALSLVEATTKAYYRDTSENFDMEKVLKFLKVAPRTQKYRELVEKKFLRYRDTK